MSVPLKLAEYWVAIDVVENTQPSTNKAAAHFVEEKKPPDADINVFLKFFL